MSTFNTWMAVANQVGQIQFDGDKIVLKKIFIDSPDQPVEQTCDPTKGPDADSPVCDDAECAGEKRRCTKASSTITI
jgi:hypothetical protein